ncbi:MAG: hypothetical protein FWE80_03525 [Oscillospiraceae bacterium]|nr:hypothetical protein [Oscillospiraceae bacterium]
MNEHDFYKQMLSDKLYPEEQIKTAVLEETPVTLPLTRRQEFLRFPAPPEERTEDLKTRSGRRWIAEIAAVAAAVALLAGLFMISFGSAGPVNPGPEDPIPPVQIMPQKETYPKNVKTITAVWRNNNAFDIIIGAGFRLEKLSGGSWEAIPLENGPDSPVLDYGLASGAEQEITYDILPYTDYLEPGQYRILGFYSYESDNPENEYTAFGEAYGEFAVTGAANPLIFTALVNDVFEDERICSLITADSDTFERIWFDPGHTPPLDFIPVFGQRVEVELEAEMTEAEYGVILATAKSITLSPHPDFDAQYIRTSGYYENIDHKKVTVIESKQQLDTYYKENNELLGLNYGWDGRSVFAQAIKQYDDAFFKDNLLVIATLIEGSGSHRHIVTGVDFDKAEIQIRGITAGSGTDDMATWQILVGLARSKCQSTNFTADVTYKSYYPEPPPPEPGPNVHTWIDYYKGEEMPWDEDRQIKIPAFDGVIFTWTPDKVTVLESSGIRELFFGMPVWNVFFCDLTGDGKPELCATVNWEMCSGFDYVLVYDYANGRQYTLSDRGNYSHSLTVYNDELIVIRINCASVADTVSGVLALVDGELKIENTLDANRTSVSTTGPTTQATSIPTTAETVPTTTAVSTTAAVTTPAIVTLTPEKASYPAGVQAITVTWHNDTSMSIVFGEPYKLEQYSNGGWQEVNEKHVVAFAQPAYLIPPYSEGEHTYLITKYTDNIQPGRYRIATDYHDKSKTYPDGKYDIYAEFAIE